MLLPGHPMPSSDFHGHLHLGEYTHTYTHMHTLEHARTHMTFCSCSDGTGIWWNKSVANHLWGNHSVIVPACLKLPWLETCILTLEFSGSQMLQVSELYFCSLTHDWVLVFGTCHICLGSQDTEVKLCTRHCFSCRVITVPVPQEAPPVWLDLDDTFENMGVCIVSGFLDSLQPFHTKRNSSVLCSPLDSWVS